MTDFQQQLGPFRLHTPIGRDTFFHFYRATDTRTGYSVIVRVLVAELAENPERVQNFLATGTHLVRLRHPNLIPILAVDEADGVYYIATHWVRGVSLSEQLRQLEDAPDLDQIFRIITSLASALDYLHNQEIVHGRVNLENIYIAEDNTPFLNGLVRLALSPPVALAPAQDGERPVAADAYVSPYMAPEQVTTWQLPDRHTDIYSLGAVAYALLLGQPPVVADDPDVLLSEVAGHGATPPEAVNPALPNGVAYVLKSALAYDPAKRYATATDFAQAFVQSCRLFAGFIQPAHAQEQTSLVLVGSEAQSSDHYATLWRRGRLIFALVMLSLVLASALAVGRGLPGVFSPRGETAQASEEGAVTRFVQRIQGYLPAQRTREAQEMAGATVTVELLTPVILSATGGPPVAAMAAVTMSTPFAATATAIPPTVASTGAPTSSNSSAPTTAADTLLLDPLGLLAGELQAGATVINGAGVPDYQVQLLVNGKSRGATRVKSTGTWSFVIALPEAGSYAIEAQMFDKSQRLVATVQQPLTVVGPASTPGLALNAKNGSGPMAEVPTNTVTPTALGVAQLEATSTATATETAEQAAAQPAPAASVVAPLATATATSLPTATATTPAPLPTATATHTPQPTATVPLPTATPTVPPTPSATATLPPTATSTTTPKPTATNTPQPTATAPLPTATPTVPPTATATVPPTATATDTPQPTATDTPRPTVTNTPQPTATATPLPTATASNTPLPTATATEILRPTATPTDEPTVTPSPSPTPLPTNTPRPTATPTPRPTPTVATGSVTLLAPGDGESGSGERTFQWAAGFTPAADTAFELVFWKEGQEPMTSSIGMAAPTTATQVNVNLTVLDDRLGGLFDTGEYLWGVLLVRTTPEYQRVQYLGGGWRFTYYRSGSGSSSGGQSSGE